MWMFFFMLWPIIIGLLRYTELNFPYRLLVYSCTIIFFNQILFYFFKDIPGYKLSPFWNNIFNYYKVLCYLPSCVYIVVIFSKMKHKFFLVIVFTLFVIGLITIEIYLKGLNEIRASLALSLSSVLSVLFFIAALIQLLNQNLPRKTKQSALLFVVPFIIVCAYDISLDIFMYFLYSNETKHVFLTFFGLILNISKIYYLCIALSIWWAPKREVFI